MISTIILIIVAAAAFAFGYAVSTGRSYLRRRNGFRRRIAGLGAQVGELRERSCFSRTGRPCGLIAWAYTHNLNLLGRIESKLEAAAGLSDRDLPEAESLALEAESDVIAVRAAGECVERYLLKQVVLDRQKFGELLDEIESLRRQLSKRAERHARSQDMIDETSRLRQLGERITAQRYEFSDAEQFAGLRGLRSLLLDLNDIARKLDAKTGVA